MTEALLLREQNPRSHRWVLLADEGASIWFYLTEPNGARPIADCWLLNTVPVPTNLDAYRSAKTAPPATSQYAGAKSQAGMPSADSVRFQWSSDGESVAVFISNELLGFIASGRNRGYSRHLIAEGPYGQPMDKSLYASLFS